MTETLTEIPVKQHDFECVAIGEKGRYFWRCSGCLTVVPYPSPASAFPTGACGKNYLANQ